ncbi:MAG: L-threonylcarbamoyladenylate synthase [Jaaginema sp. PMC 1079.18]|nr:L-threonylcarbamoyladenylate synthase [Jaaginema sp. PMC 1080.18]MEC4852176.1 L-threonylcarbamoyladenylate synthase [Jaaginema sp. PMC 1079.18]MEC4864925.1 L-threonylcarbamoyladenylate synthase [Jaaginema sp. PMC 1078.18]
MVLVSQAALIAEAIAGEVVSFPTDTVPALAVRPGNADLIFSLKQRSLDKPLILMGASWQQILPYLGGTSNEIAVWEKTTQKYWPGALTLVLRTSEAVPRAMNPRDPSTLGVRIPDCAIALAILRETGPLATTSANRSGEPPLEDLGAIATAFPTVLALEGIASPPGSGLPSTVVRWTGRGWEVLRQGSVLFS